MQNCRTKETNKCFYLTKENRKEFLKECFPKLENDLNNNYCSLNYLENGFVIIDFNKLKHMTIFNYNCWYVQDKDYDYPKFVKYTEEEFNKNYQLVEKENK